MGLFVTLVLVLPAVLLPARRYMGVDQNMSYLFETHPIVLQYMVPSLITVYSDVEHTDRNNQFYAKFNMRQYIGGHGAWLCLAS